MTQTYDPFKSKTKKTDIPKFILKIKGTHKYLFKNYLKHIRSPLKKQRLFQVPKVTPANFHKYLRLEKVKNPKYPPLDPAAQAFLDQLQSDRVRTHYEPNYPLRFYIPTPRTARQKRSLQRASLPRFDNETGKSLWWYSFSKNSHVYQPPISQESFTYPIPPMSSVKSPTMADWVGHFTGMIVDLIANNDFDQWAETLEAQISDGQYRAECRAHELQNIFQSQTACHLARDREVCFANPWYSMQNEIGPEKAMVDMWYPNVHTKWIITFKNPVKNSPITDENILHFMTHHCYGIPFMGTLNRDVDPPGWHVVEIESKKDVTDQNRAIVPDFIRFLRYYKVPFKIWPATLFHAVQPEAKITYQETLRALSKFPWQTFNWKLIQKEAYRLGKKIEKMAAITMSNVLFDRHTFGYSLLSGEYKSYVKSIKNKYKIIHLPGEMRLGDFNGPMPRPYAFLEEKTKAIFYVLPLLLLVISTEIVQGLRPVRFFSHLKGCPYFKPVWREWGKAPMRYSFADAKQGFPVMMFLDSALRENVNMHAIADMFLDRCVKNGIYRNTTTVAEFFKHPVIRAKMGFILPEADPELYLVHVTPIKKSSTTSESSTTSKPNALFSSQSSFRVHHDAGHTLNPIPQTMEYRQESCGDLTLQEVYRQIRFEKNFSREEPFTFLVVQNKIITKSTKHLHLSRFKAKQAEDYFHKKGIYFTRFPYTPKADFIPQCKHLTKLLTKLTLIPEDQCSISDCFKKHQIYKRFALPDGKSIGIELFDHVSLKPLQILDIFKTSVQDLRKMIKDETILVHIFDPDVNGLLPFEAKKISRTINRYVAHLYKNKWHLLANSQKTRSKLRKKLGIQNNWIRLSPKEIKERIQTKIPDNPQYFPYTHQTGERLSSDDIGKIHAHIFKTTENCPTINRFTELKSELKNYARLRPKVGLQWTTPFKSLAHSTLYFSLCYNFAKISKSKPCVLLHPNMNSSNMNSSTNIQAPSISGIADVWDVTRSQIEKDFNLYSAFLSKALKPIGSERRPPLPIDTLFTDLKSDLKESGKNYLVPKIWKKAPFNSILGIRSTPAPFTVMQFPDHPNQEIDDYEFQGYTPLTQNLDDINLSDQEEDHHGFSNQAWETFSSHYSAMLENNTDNNTDNDSDIDTDSVQLKKLTDVMLTRYIGQRKILAFIHHYLTDQVYPHPRDLRSQKTKPNFGKNESYSTVWKSSTNNMEFSHLDSTRSVLENFRHFSKLRNTEAPKLSYATWHNIIRFTLFRIYKRFQKNIFENLAENHSQYAAFLKQYGHIEKFKAQLKEYILYVDQILRLRESSPQFIKCPVFFLHLRQGITIINKVRDLVNEVFKQIYRQKGYFPHLQRFQTKIRSLLSYPHFRDYWQFYGEQGASKFSYARDLDHHSKDNGIAVSKLDEGRRKSYLLRMIIEQFKNLRAKYRYMGLRRITEIKILYKLIQKVEKFHRYPLQMAKYQEKVSTILQECIEVITGQARSDNPADVRVLQERIITQLESMQTVWGKATNRSSTENDKWLTHRFVKLFRIERNLAKNISQFQLEAHFPHIDLKTINYWENQILDPWKAREISENRTPPPVSNNEALPDLIPIDAFLSEEGRLKEVKFSEYLVARTNPLIIPIQDRGIQKFKNTYFYSGAQDHRILNMWQGNLFAGTGRLSSSYDSFRLGIKRNSSGGFVQKKAGISNREIRQAFEKVVSKYATLPDAKMKMLEDNHSRHSGYYNLVREFWEDYENLEVNSDAQIKKIDQQIRTNSFNFGHNNMEPDSEAAERIKKKWKQKRQQLLSRPYGNATIFKIYSRKILLEGIKDGLPKFENHSLQYHAPLRLRKSKKMVGEFYTCGHYSIPISKFEQDDLDLTNSKNKKEIIKQAELSQIFQIARIKNIIPKKQWEKSEKEPYIYNFFTISKMKPPAKITQQKDKSKLDKKSANLRPLSATYATMKQYLDMYKEIHIINSPSDSSHKFYQEIFVYETAGFYNFIIMAKNNLGRRTPNSIYNAVIDPQQAFLYWKRKLQTDFYNSRTKIHEISFDTDDNIKPKEGGDRKNDISKALKQYCHIPPEKKGGHLVKGNLSGIKVLFHPLKSIQVTLLSSGHLKIGYVYQTFSYYRQFHSHYRLGIDLGLRNFGTVAHSTSRLTGSTELAFENLSPSEYRTRFELLLKANDIIAKRICQRNWLSGQEKKFHARSISAFHPPRTDARVKSLQWVKNYAKFKSHHIKEQAVIETALRQYCQTLYLWMRKYPKPPIAQSLSLPITYQTVRPPPDFNQSNTGIYIENLHLSDADKKTRWKRSTEEKHRWPYGKFRHFLTELQENRKIHCQLVDPSYTSKICPNCRKNGELGKEGRKGYLLKKRYGQWYPISDKPAIHPLSFSKICNLPSNRYRKAALSPFDYARIQSNHQYFQISDLEDSRPNSDTPDTILFYPHSTGNFLKCEYCKTIISRDIAGALNIGLSNPISGTLHILRLLLRRLGSSGGTAAEKEITKEKLKFWISDLLIHLRLAIKYPRRDSISLKNQKLAQQAYIVLEKIYSAGPRGLLVKLDFILKKTFEHLQSDLDDFDHLKPKLDNLHVDNTDFPRFLSKLQTMLQSFQDTIKVARPKKEHIHNKKKWDFLTSIAEAEEFTDIWP